MSDAAHGTDAGRGTGAVGGSQLGVLLACFSGTKAAGKARRGLDARLTTRVFAGPAEPVELPAASPGRGLPPDRDAVLSMVVLRYPDPGTAKKMAAEMAPKTKKTVPVLQAGLVIRDDGSGHRHVTDPT